MSFSVAKIGNTRSFIVEAKPRYFASHASDCAAKSTHLSPTCSLEAHRGRVRGGFSVGATFSRKGKQMISPCCAKKNMSPSSWPPKPCWAIHIGTSVTTRKENPLLCQAKRPGQKRLDMGVIWRESPHLRRGHHMGSGWDLGERHNGRLGPGGHPGPPNPEGCARASCPRKNAVNSWDLNLGCGLPKKPCSRAMVPSWTSGRRTCSIQKTIDELEGTIQGAVKGSLGTEVPFGPGPELLLVWSHTVSD